MNNSVRGLSILVCVLLLQSCASTSLSDFTDPSYTDATFYSVAVWAKTDDLEWRQDLETGMQNRVHSVTGASAIRVIDIAPPTRGFSVEETYQLLQGANVDATIVLVFTDTGINQTYQTDGYGNLQTHNKPWGAATVDVVDVKTSAVARTGNTNTRGNAFADWDDIRQSAGNQVIKKLLAIGMLPPVSQNIETE
jgi:hypothetical protein